MTLHRSFIPLYDKGIAAKRDMITGRRYVETDMRSDAYLSRTIASPPKEM
jgi:hypothetical protein